MAFVRSLAIDLNVDETTLILLLVIALFSPDRDRLTNRELIAAQQERYVATSGEFQCKTFQPDKPSRPPYLVHFKCSTSLYWWPYDCTLAVLCLSLRLKEITCAYYELLNL